MMSYFRTLDAHFGFYYLFLQHGTSGQPTTKSTGYADDTQKELKYG